jgi:hypothetical protein
MTFSSVYGVLMRMASHDHDSHDQRIPGRGRVAL